MQQKNSVNHLFIAIKCEIYRNERAREFKIYFT